MNIDELQFIRLRSSKDIDLVPRELFSEYGENMNRAVEYAKLAITSSLTGIYVLADSKYKPKGVLWFSVNLLDKNIYVEFMSVLKEIQSNGGGLSNKKSALASKALEFMQGLDLGTGDIRIHTSRPKAFERIGFSRSKLVMMEIKHEQNT